MNQQENQAGKASPSGQELAGHFKKSVEETFSKMLKTSVSQTDVRIVSDPTPPEDVTGIIGLSGTARGTVAVTFPKNTAFVIVGKLLGTELTEINEVVIDGVSELVNVLTGGAKAKLASALGGTMELGLPTVLQGTNIHLRSPSGTRWLEIDFNCDLGSFGMRIAFEKGVVV